MQVREEQLRQTNDANIPGFESHVHRFACGLPHDGRISTGWPKGSVTYGPLQLGVPKNRMVWTGRWLVIDLPTDADAANGWLRYWTPMWHRPAVLELVRRHQGHDGMNTHLLFGAPLPLRLPEVTTMVEQLGQIFDATPVPFEPLSRPIPILMHATFFP